MPAARAGVRGGGARPRRRTTSRPAPSCAAPEPALEAGQPPASRSATRKTGGEPPLRGGTEPLAESVHVPVRGGRAASRLYERTETKPGPPHAERRRSRAAKRSMEIAAGRRRTSRRAARAPGRSAAAQPVLMRGRRGARSCRARLARTRAIEVVLEAVPARGQLEVRRKSSRARRPRTRRRQSQALNGTSTEPSPPRGLPLPLARATARGRSCTGEAPARAPRHEGLLSAASGARGLCVLASTAAPGFAASYERRIPSFVRMTRPFASDRNLWDAPQARSADATVARCAPPRQVAST